MMSTKQLQQLANNTKTTQATTNPLLETASRRRPERSVEEMLKDISLVLWLTRKVKEEILADHMAEETVSIHEEELVVCG